jgi:glyoxylase-like metal-dependent hydrolase (beta-lactamase superfamily II)
MKLAPHLHRIGSDMVNAYLVEDESGVTVIDAGLPGHWQELKDELDVLGRKVEDVRGLILTHGDSDHLGFAERLRQTGVPVFVHQADAALATGETKKRNPSWGRMRVGPTVGFLWYAARHGGMRVTPVAKVDPAKDGETLSFRRPPDHLNTGTQPREHCHRGEISPRPLRG